MANKSTCDIGILVLTFQENIKYYLCKSGFNLCQMKLVDAGIPIISYVFDIYIYIHTHICCCIKG